MWELIVGGGIGVIGTLSSSLLGMCQERQRSKAAMAQQKAQFKQNMLDATRQPVIDAVQEFLPQCNDWIDEVRRYEVDLEQQLEAASELAEFIELDSDPEPSATRGEYDISQLEKLEHKKETSYRNLKAQQLVISQMAEKLEDAAAQCELLVPPKVAKSIRDFTTRAKLAKAKMNEYPHSKLSNQLKSYSSDQFILLRGHIIDKTREWSYS